MIDFLDVQASTPDIRISVDKVGIRRMKFPIKIGDEVAILSADLYIDIPQTRKGADMSRAVESIQSVLSRPSINLESLGIEICKEALGRFNYASRVEVKINGEYYKKSNGGYDEISLYIRTKCGIDGNIENLTGLSYEAITACPCAMETTRALISKDIPDSENVLYYIPTVTHNQRNRTKLIVSNNAGKISFWDIYKVLESVQGKPLESLLKRIDEGKLVYEAHKKPKFVEDVVREVAFAAVTLLPLSDDDMVIVSSDSEESIHPHNAYASMKKRALDLKKELNL
ncbi:hypothetical protein [Thermoplasma volcanium GSS1]|uniref:GTP cyclohydrolase MptA n=1 Tax=Thermoplasma volcanium (strain ATCC 51530 / DSM 4299 / JCM 9571 / NBRC 15438 / GSS1) TaxID=273116 RepID=MPTA_THEVO|nr:GTP cyclohydrolase MptA [Thermoplasma volcanium]Q979C3.1 RecName: Full=GTP cyclohydrolase MptA; AltName: Full=GTP cyclohydrolase IV [Thermoplasma volcanium GSS1]BAB60380.1 hypothetical protein [Thermoplasma volcanium GSS1]